jgi:hypothetical protein
LFWFNLEDQIAKEQKGVSFDQDLESLTPVQTVKKGNSGVTRALIN